MYTVKDCYNNRQLAYLEKQINQHKERIPNGKSKIITIDMNVHSYNLFDINDLLKKYPDAVLLCYKPDSIYEYRDMTIKGYIDPKKLKELEDDGIATILRFRFNVIGSSKKFIDRLRISNWFITSS